MRVFAHCASDEAHTQPECSGGAAQLVPPGPLALPGRGEITACGGHLGLCLAIDLMALADRSAPGSPRTGSRGASIPPQAIVI